MPRILAGSSVGSIICTGIAAHKYTDLWKIFNKDYGFIDADFMRWKFNSKFEGIFKLAKGETILDINNVKKECYKHIKDMTFLEVFEKNRWNLNITVTDGMRWGESKLLNYLTAPNVVIWSACCASCAIPGFYDSVELMIKTEDGVIKPYYHSNLRGNFKFIDGSVASDLPMNRMGELFNINTFIIS
jgi:predicted acylesterase/phospholipase RssA